MDYSKVGSKLYNAIKISEAKAGRVIRDMSLPSAISTRTIEGCDTVIIKNRGVVEQLFDNKPISVTVNNLNAFGNLVHKFQGLYAYKRATETAENIEKYFADLHIGALLKAFQQGGLEGVYTLFLNKAATGVTPESFNRLQKKLAEEYKKFGIDLPEVDIRMKKIIEKSDFNYLPWKTKGFAHPKEIKMPAFTDESYKITRQYYDKHRIDTRIPDGYRDPGRQFTYKRSGELEGIYKEPFARETIVVDRRQDTVYRQTVQRLKEIMDQNPDLTTGEKIRTLYTFVEELFKLPKSAAMVEEFKMRPMLIGDIIASGAGVCRHMALCAKLLGDEIGLNISLVRGRILDSNRYASSHIWNEITTKNGKYIFDTAQRKLIKLDSGDEFIKRYFTQNRLPMYLQ